jgi:hypothetical protein
VQGKIDLNFQVNRTIWIQPEKGDVIEEDEDLDKDSGLFYQAINSTMPYRFYRLDDPYLKEFDNHTWNQSSYSDKTETRDFAPKQVQFCVLRRHSDQEMQLS